MSRLAVPLAAMVLFLASCGGSGRNYYLYPEPHLTPEEGAVLIVYEGHQVQSVDGEEAYSRCWGFARERQAYSRNDVACRLHLEPGEHTVSFADGGAVRQLHTVTFTAEAGKAYGLDRSSCVGNANASGRTCEVNVIEVSGE